ncbi:MAG: DUF2283 domain-containing protein [Burkholderiales bacterium]
MKVQYFEDTDTVLVTLNNNPVAETKDLDENTLLDLDSEGNLVSITIEHAKDRADISNFSFEQVAA